MTMEARSTAIASRAAGTVERSRSAASLGAAAPPSAALSSVRDGGLALAVTVGLALLYALTLQERVSGDGAGLASLYARPDFVYYNVGWEPLCRLLGLFVPRTADLFLVPKLASALGAAIGCGATVLLSRGLGVGRFGAAAGALVLGLTPAVWHQGTTIEAHAVHFGVLASMATVTLLAPWRRPALALTLAALALAVTYTTQHITLLVGPAWVLLVQAGRARRAEPFRWRTLLLVVGPVLLAALVLTLLLANLWRFGSFTLTVENLLFRVRISYHPVRALRVFWDDWALRPFLALPLGLLGLVRGPFACHARLALALGCGVPLAYFLAWGVPEDGGYFLGSACFWGVAMAGTLDRPGARGAIGVAALLVALGVQVAVTRVLCARHDSRWTMSERVELARRALGTNGLFVSTLDVPSLTLWDPGLEQISVHEALAGMVPPDVTATEGYAPVILTELERRLRTHERLVLDLGYRSRQERRIIALRAPCYAVVEEELRRRHSTRVIQHPRWPMLVVERP